MNILSFKFLLYLLIVFSIYWLAPNKFRKNILLCSSILFCLFQGYLNGILVIIYALLAYLLHKYVNSKNKLIISIIVLLIPLLTSKYYNLIIEGLKIAFPKLSLSIIGISFLSFKAISFIVNEYKNNEEVNILDFIAYMLYFPTLLSGPIERFKNFVTELNKDKSFDWDEFVRSLFIISFGFFIKLAIADRLFIVLESIVENKEAYGYYTILVFLAYPIYIYADFAGYSSMALGISKLFGIDITNNFKQPYFSNSIKQFWNRWHISLNNWFKDYIYIPLGGNKLGPARKYLNVLIVFLLSGIWHGAGLGFIIWGLLNGLFQIIGDITRDFRDKIYSRLHLNDTFIQKYLRIAFVYVLIAITWVFFYQGFTGSIELFKTMFAKSSLSFMEFAIDLCAKAETSKVELFVLVFSSLFMIIVDFLQANDYQLLDRIIASNWCIRYAMLMILILAVIIYGKYGNGLSLQSFIYFKF